MQRISVHISETTKQRINLASKAKNKVEAELIRDALDIGLNILYPQSSSAQALLDLAKMAEQLPNQPGKVKDLSINHDYYAWGGKKKK